MARTGRPPKAPEKGRRQNYTFRMSDQTRDRIIEAAAQAGRSMSEEIEARVEASFRDDGLRAAIREEVRAALDGLTIHHIEIDEDEDHDDLGAAH